MSDDQSFIRTHTPVWLETRLDEFSDAVNARTPEWFEYWWFGFKIYTDRTDRVLDAAERFAPFWNVSNGTLGVGAMLVFIPVVLLMIGAFAAVGILGDIDPTRVHDPVNWLVIPGANDFLPLATTPYILLGLAVGMSVHEFGHGIAARLENIPVEETGVAFLFGLPIAAYVELDDDKVDDLSLWPKLKIYSAGITNNLWVTIVLGWLASVLTVSLSAVVTSYYGSGLPTNSDVLAVTITANVVFWVWFLNLNLAISQAIPLYVTDGARVIEALADAVCQRFAIDREGLPSRLNKTVALATIGALTLGMVVPWLSTIL